MLFNIVLVFYIFRLNAVALPADISSQTDSNDQGKIKNGCQTFRQVFKLFSPGLNETVTITNEMKSI